MLGRAAIAPGMRVLCRDAKWLVTRVDSADAERQFRAVHCVGADELVRGQERIFLEQLNGHIEPVDPRKTQLVPDASSGYRLCGLFLEAQLRQMPVTDTAPHLERMGAFKPMDYQTKAVQRALLQLRPRLLLADAVGLGKTIEVGMILTELARRGRGDRLLALAKQLVLTQFQSELWNRFGIPLVRLDSEGIARLITLLDPSAIPDPRLKEYGPDDIKRFFLMRFKEDIREEAGDSLRDRVVVPLEDTSAAASPEEEEVFRVFADIRKTISAGKTQTRQAEPLVQYGLYKQFLSSPECCLDTLLKRLKKLREQDPQSAELAHLERLHETMLGLSLGSSSR